MMGVDIPERTLNRGWEGAMVAQRDFQQIF